jgi:hypothetical protein
MAPQRTILKTGSISDVEYDEETQSLEITFRNGRSYTLTGVPPDMYDGLITADSPGSYYNTYLRGRY